MKLSKNFSLKELTRSQTAIRKGIDNAPNSEQLVNLTVLAQQVLQPCREQFGSISVNSGLRVLELNRAIGSGDKSQHIDGEAADFEAYKVSNRELAEWINEALDFDQLILEYPGSDPRDGWVHCSFKKDGSNRNRALTAVKEGGKTVYKKGLQE
jgi:zinc D-Ala-D-Ala carboxypeptidase|tara:strand:+ start:147 stop:608 length:462 start_codon:yes stop_codon:yes gene_type:complete